MTYNGSRFKVDDIREVRGEAFRTIEHNDCTVRALTVAAGVKFTPTSELEGGK
jgi:hypothetical protein